MPHNWTSMLMEYNPRPGHHSLNLFFQMNSLADNQNIQSNENTFSMWPPSNFSYYSFSVIITGMSMLPYAANTNIYALEDLRLRPWQTGMALS